MAKLKLKQVLSNVSYNAATNQLFVSGSTGPTIIVSGSIFVTSSVAESGSITIAGVDNFGDSGSFYTVDLGQY